MKPFRLGVFAVAIALAACTSSPTSHSADPAGPSYDGGNMIGSGTSEEGPAMPSSGNGTSSDTTSNGGTERGGASLGSGN